VTIQGFAIQGCSMAGLDAATRGAGRDGRCRRRRRSRPRHSDRERDRGEPLDVNDGKGVFSDMSVARLPKDSRNGQGIAVGDVDGDLDVDLVLAMLGQNRLYLNDGKGTFLDATASGLPITGEFSYSVALGDFDSDGDLDLAFANGLTSLPLEAQRNRIYLNDGKGDFSAVSGDHARLREERRGRRRRR